MNTQNLIALLASDATPVSRYAVRRRFAIALAAGLLLSVGWVLALYGVRTDLAQIALTPGFGAKLAMPLAVAVSGLLVLVRLAQPGAAPSRWRIGLWLPVVLLWLWAAWTLAQAPVEARAGLVLGSTWRTCVLNVALASLPVGAALFWALKGLAPTRPGTAGMTAGWLAGGVGACTYALHCPEMAAPFLAVWYVLGMSACALLGLLAGQRWLRW